MLFLHKKSINSNTINRKLEDFLDNLNLELISKIRKNKNLFPKKDKFNKPTNKN